MVWLKAILPKPLWLFLPYSVFATFKWWFMGLCIKTWERVVNEGNSSQKKKHIAVQAPLDNRYFNKTKWKRMCERIRPEKGGGTSTMPKMSLVDRLHVLVTCLFLLHLQLTIHVCASGCSQLLSLHVHMQCINWHAFHPAAGGLSKPDESEGWSSVFLYLLSAGSGSPLTQSHFISKFGFSFV